MRKILVSVLLLLSMWAFVTAQHKTQSQRTESTRLVSEGWFDNAVQQIHKDEYSPSLQSFDYQGKPFIEARLHLVNRAHNLRAYFDENGMELMPRVIVGSNFWMIRYRMNSIQQHLEPNIVDDLIVYEGQHAIVEYSNSETGLEQHIVIQKNLRKDKKLRIKAHVETQGLQITHTGNNRFVFTDGRDCIIYKIVKAEDAHNNVLKSSIEYDRFGNVTIALEDSEAVYPVSIRLSVSSDDGQSEENMSVRISTPMRESTPNWVGESNQDSAHFGWSVSSAGDVNGDGYADVIVGAHSYDNGQPNEGRAFVYQGSASGLSQTPDWTAESDQTDAHFGCSVSSAGDVNGDGYGDVIVGAHSYDNGQPDEGCAFVYQGSATGLSQTPDWAAESDQDYAYFGLSVSCAGDINASGYSDVIVGAYSYDNGQPNEGRAFVYQGSATGLSQTPDWTAESNQAHAHFGWSVSSAGDINGDGYADVIVGARYYDNGQPNEGRAFVYHGSMSGLSHTPDWTAESDQADAHFGWSVSSAGDVNASGYSDIIIGAQSYDNREADEGRAFVYHGSMSGLSQTPDWTAESNQAHAHFGWSVSSAGDVNASGYSDVVVGAHSYDNGQVDEGRAFVYRGSPNGLLRISDWTAESDQDYAHFGCSVSSAGDVNGDGYADVIVGAYTYDNGQTDEGCAFVYHHSATPLHNISALGIFEPADHIYEEFSTIQPSAVFRNTGIFSEINIPVILMIYLDNNPVYTSGRIIDSLAQQTDTVIVFDDFSLGVCGGHYCMIAFSCLPEDSFFYDDTTAPKAFAAARIYELRAPSCNAWTYPNADSGYVPSPTSPYWIPATQNQLLQISALDSMWWVTAGATNEAHQDLQLYGIQLDAVPTLIEALRVEWWGHHGEQIHHACGMYFWNQQAETWSQRVDSFNVTEDVLLQCEVPTDSISMFVSDSGYIYASVGADYNEIACCPLLFIHNEEEDVFIGDVIVGCDLGMWIDRTLGCNLYVPPDYDEYVKIDGECLKDVDGMYHLTINEMLQEVSYLDEIRLYVVDHPVDYDIYPHEALIFPGYQGLSIHTSQESALRAATDEYGRDLLHTLEAEDRIYAPFEKSGITGFAKPFTVTLDLGELEDPSSAVLYLYGNTRFQDSDEIEPVSDIYQANKRNMKMRNPMVQVMDASGRWNKIASCGMPRGHKKTVTYPLFDEYGNTIFASDDHRLRVTFYSEVYLDKAWVSCYTADDFRVVELEPEIAALHYFGYAEYNSPDGKYPGDYYYNTKEMRDYANVVGYYTRYGDVKPLLDDADSKFVIMCHGDELSLEFDADELPRLNRGWKRDFIFAAKGFYKMALPGRAYAYSVDPLPFYGMREDMSANGVGYYPYDPSPNLFVSLLGRIYGKIVFDYPFSLSDALTMIKAHLTGTVKNKYPEELTEYCKEWNTRHVSAYFPDFYADVPPHLNLERVPLHENEGKWTTRLASLGIPFGDHSLYSNYFRILMVTTVPIGIAEEKVDVPMEFMFSVGQPNPFRKSTTISYSIASKAHVKIRIYDVSGRLVNTLVDDVQQPGLYSRVWDGTDDFMRKCAAGSYFVKFEAGDRKSKRKLIFLK